MLVWTTGCYFYSIFSWRQITTSCDRLLQAVLSRQKLQRYCDMLLHVVFIQGKKRQHYCDRLLHVVFIWGKNFNTIVIGCYMLSGKNFNTRNLFGDHISKTLFETEPKTSSRLARCKWKTLDPNPMGESQTRSKPRFPSRNPLVPFGPFPNDSMLVIMSRDNM